MITRISEGRLIADFPVGSATDTCYACGQNPSMLCDRYQKAHDLILRASTNEKHSIRPLQFGNMNKGLAHYNTKLFAEKVRPKFKPMDTALRAAVPACLAAE